MSGIHASGAFGRIASGGIVPSCAIIDQLAYVPVGMEPRWVKMLAGMAPDLCRSAGERSP
jgi:hypothetical protein